MSDLEGANEPLIDKQNPNKETSRSKNSCRGAIDAFNNEKSDIIEVAKSDSKSR